MQAERIRLELWLLLTFLLSDFNCSRSLCGINIFSVKVVDCGCQRGTFQKWVYLTNQLSASHNERKPWKWDCKLTKLFSIYFPQKGRLLCEHSWKLNVNGIKQNQSHWRRLNRQQRNTGEIHAPCFRLSQSILLLPFNTKYTTPVCLLRDPLLCCHKVSQSLKSQAQLGQILFLCKTKISFLRFGKCHNNFRGHQGVYYLGDIYSPNARSLESMPIIFH